MTKKIRTKHMRDASEMTGRCIQIRIGKMSYLEARGLMDFINSQEYSDYVEIRVAVEKRLNEFCHDEISFGLFDTE